MRFFLSSFVLYFSLGSGVCLLASKPTTGLSQQVHDVVSTVSEQVTSPSTSAKAQASASWAGKKMLRSMSYNLVAFFGTALAKYVNTEGGKQAGDRWKQITPTEPLKMASGVWEYTKGTWYPLAISVAISPLAAMIQEFLGQNIEFAKNQPRLVQNAILALLYPCIFGWTGGLFFNARMVCMVWATSACSVGLIEAVAFVWAKIKANRNTSPAAPVLKAELKAKVSLD